MVAKLKIQDFIIQDTHKRLLDILCSKDTSSTTESSTSHTSTASHKSNHTSKVMVVFKRAAKELDINCRHSGALNGHDRNSRRILLMILQRLRDQLQQQNGNQAAVKRIWRMTKSCIKKLLSIISIPRLIFVAYNGCRLRIDSEVIQNAMIPITYRFKNRS